MVNGTGLPAPREQRAALDRLDADPDILTAMCERIAGGVSEVDVAHDYGVSLRRLGRWLEDTAHPERREEYEFALRVYVRRLGRETVAIADEQAVAYSKSGAAFDPDVPRDTLRVNTRLKVASKLDRMLWGDTQTHIVDDRRGGAASAEQLREELAALLARNPDVKRQLAGVLEGEYAEILSEATTGTVGGVGEGEGAAVLPTGQGNPPPAHAAAPDRDAVRAARQIQAEVFGEPGLVKPAKPVLGLI